MSTSFACVFGPRNTHQCFNTQLPPQGKRIFQALSELSPHRCYFLRESCLALGTQEWPCFYRRRSMGLLSLRPVTKVLVMAFVALEDTIVKALAFLGHLLIACRLQSRRGGETEKTGCVSRWLGQLLATAPVGKRFALYSHSVLFIIC